MPRLPIPGKDENSWGGILNDYLSVEHNADGTLKDVARVSDISAKYTKPSGGIPQADLDSTTRAKLDNIGVVADDSITTSKLADNAVTNTKIADGTIAASKLTATVNNYLASAQTAIQSVNGKSGQNVSLKIDDLSGVVTSGIVDGQALIRSGTGWAPGSVITKSTNSIDQGKAIDAYTGLPLAMSGSAVARPIIYSQDGAGSARGIRRWMQAASNALNTQCFIDVIGDSHVFGVGGDDANAGLAANNVADSTKGWVGQLRQLAQLSNAGGVLQAGEGTIYANYANEGRTTASGVGSNVPWSGSMRRSARLIGSSQTITYTVETGVTTLGVVQANQTQSFNSAGSNLADVSASWSKNGTNQGAITTLDNSGVPRETRLSVNSGDTIVISGPATAQTYVSLLATYKDSSKGIVVNRQGVTGSVVGDLLGGQTSGALSPTTAQQMVAIDATHAWHTPGLVILPFLSNDQQYQSGGGTANQNGVTLANFTAWMQIAVSRIVANGHCVLLIGNIRSGTAANSGNTEAEYVAALKSIATSMDHVSFADMADIFGSSAQMVAGSQQFASSPHMKQVGHAIFARNVWRLINPAGLYGYQV